MVREQQPPSLCLRCGLSAAPLLPCAGEVMGPPPVVLTARGKNKRSAASSKGRSSKHHKKSSRSQRSAKFADEVPAEEVVAAAAPKGRITRAKQRELDALKEQHAQMIDTMRETAARREAVRSPPNILRALFCLPALAARLCGVREESASGLSACARARAGVEAADLSLQGRGGAPADDVAEVKGRRQVQPRRDDGARGKPASAILSVGL